MNLKLEILCRLNEAERLMRISCLALTRLKQEKKSPAFKAEQKDRCRLKGFSHGRKRSL
jgi:hypothetical protein